MTTMQAFWTVVIIATVTLFTRAVPFLLFPESRKTPAFVLYLGKVLPYAMMGMLVVYCLKETRVLAYPYGIPELLGVGAVAWLYLWRKNTLLAIAGGTLLYMLLVQQVFL